MEQTLSAKEKESELLINRLSDEVARLYALVACYAGSLAKLEERMTDDKLPEDYIEAVRFLKENAETICKEQGEAINENNALYESVMPSKPIKDYRGYNEVSNVSHEEKEAIFIRDLKKQREREKEQLENPFEPVQIDLKRIIRNASKHKAERVAQDVE